MIQFEKFEAETSVRTEPFVKSVLINLFTQFCKVGYCVYLKRLNYQMSIFLTF